MQIKIGLLILSVCAGLCGRLGGRGKDGSWYDVITDTKVRDLGIPILFTLFMLYSHPIYNLKAVIAYFITFGLMFGALTTYWDEVPFNKGKDNYFMAGFFVGLSTISCMFSNVRHPFSILVRTIILAGIWGSLNKYLPKLWFKDRTVVVEFLRYFFTVLILTI